jgi:hypothetical protein
MNELSRRRALLVGAYAGLYASLPKVARTQPSADSKWEMAPPLPKTMGEVVGVAIDRSLFVFGGLNDAAGEVLTEPRFDLTLKGTLDGAP